MRFRLVATYLGATYQAALGPGREDVTLFAACPPPEELGFSSAAGHWRKLVDIADIDGLRQSRPIGLYRGANCLVLDDQVDRLHIAYLGDDADQARELGYWEIDREVFEMVVPRADVSDLYEAQTDVPVDAVIIPAVPLGAPVEAAGSVLAAVDADADEYRAEADADEYRAEADADEYRAEADADEYRAEPGADEHRILDRMAAWHGSPEPWPVHGQFATANGHGYSNGNGTRTAGPRMARRERVPIQAVFTELADLAAIPQSAYALDDEVPGAMCLLKTDDGFEVFASSGDARHEVRFFEDEEAAYFYLFGVLAAESLRNGRLLPAAPASATSGEKISKYLRERNSHNYPPNTVRVLIAGGADGPPLPKQPRRPPSEQPSRAGPKYGTLITLRITKRDFHHFITVHS